MSKRRKPISRSFREKIASRAYYRCEYCQSPKAYSAQSYVIEHIIPLSKEGTSKLENLAYACGGCNQHKYNKVAAIDPINAQVVPLFNPRKEIWIEHFTWNENYLEIIGVTGIGRATVLALNMNRIELINLRNVLKLVHIHPPKQ